MLVCAIINTYTNKQGLKMFNFNNDDYYVIDMNNKTVVKSIGKQKVPFMQDPTYILKSYITSNTQVIMKGMKAKYFMNSGV